MNWKRSIWGESCTRPARSRCVSTTSVSVFRRSMVPPASQRYSFGPGWVLISPSQACRAPPHSILLRDVAALPNSRRSMCSTVARGPVFALTPTPNTSCWRGASSTCTDTGAAAACSGVASTDTVARSKSPDFCKRSWKSSTRVSVRGVPGPKLARWPTVSRSCRRRPSTRNSPLRNKGPGSAVKDSRAWRWSGSISAWVRAQLAARWPLARSRARLSVLASAQAGLRKGAPVFKGQCWRKPCRACTASVRPACAASAQSADSCRSTRLTTVRGPGVSCRRRRGGPSGVWGRRRWIRISGSK